MKARTKLEQRAEKLLAKYNKNLSPAQRKWATTNDYYYGGHLRKTLYCFECGNSQKTEKYFKGSFTYGQKYQAECSHCKKTLEVINQNWYYLTYVVGILQRIEDFQTLKIYQVQKIMNKGKEPEYRIRLVAAYMLPMKGKLLLFSRGRNMQGMYDYRDISVKKFDRFYSDISQASLYPRYSVHPELARKGFNRKFYNVGVMQFLKELRDEPKVEILLKTGGDLFLNKFRFHWYLEWWQQIRMAIKHKYSLKPEELSDWIDYLKNIQYFGKDLNSPRWVFPKNLKKAHDKYLKEKRRRELHKGLEEITPEQREFFAKKMRKFEKIEIEKDGVRIQPLRSIEEIMNEEIEMHHCVFTNSYFNRKSSVLFTSFVDGKKAETIEVDLTGKVQQSRGHCNNLTDHHEKIVSLVEEALPKLLKRKTKTT
jgi:hypothetical protein